MEGQIPFSKDRKYVTPGGMGGRYFAFSAYFSVYLLSFTASQRKEDVSEEREGNVRDGMDLEAGGTGKEL